MYGLPVGPLGPVLPRQPVLPVVPQLRPVVPVLLIMILRRVLARLTFLSKTMGSLFKGEDIELWKDGKYNEENMRRTCITQADILMSLHYAHMERMDDIDAIYLERSGEINIVKKKYSDNGDRHTGMDLP